MAIHPPVDVALDHRSPQLAAAPRLLTGRPEVRGKYLYAGGEPLYLRGVTYGPLGPPDSSFDRVTAERDFEQMVVAGINCVRVYDVPETWLLDAAAARGIRIMIGIPWEQHVAFLADRTRCRSIEERVGAAVRSCAGHPAVLCYVIGNEIPASIVRWHGRAKVERFLRRLYLAAKKEDPEGLVTYVNYPSTEYLRLPFLDFAAFNVYLERRDRYEAYLYRLQHLADDRPLVMAEIGLDSRRNGQQAQAETLEWQVRSSFETGCAGIFVFAWTDQWHRGGHDILDWDFGLTSRSREPKLALAAVGAAYADAPLAPPAASPRVSVVVATYNGAKTLRRCLEGLSTLNYPDYEVIVVNDGSTDASAQIAGEYDVQLVETENRGLSAARNAGLARASGEIVAYIDDDAWPHPEWLTHLARGFAETEFAGLGGPNVLPPRAGAIEQCVANAPGGPTHVMISDRDAEHIPGCNCAFRREALEQIGGFDPAFRVAGDDVDLCWRLRERGLKLGFVPGALVWHHRRRSVRTYFRQQRGYGKAEALLERKWPEKYSPGGHVSWAGRLYGNGAAQHRGGWRWRVYYGGWGTAFFQSIYGPRKSLLESLPLMPEWYLAIAVLAALSAASILWGALLVAMPLLVGAVGALVFDALLGARRAAFPYAASGLRRRRLLTACLYLLQPVARLEGRLGYGLSPWRRRGPDAPSLPLPGEAALWSEDWAAGEDRVRALRASLTKNGSVVDSGGDWDRFDLQVRGGALGAARLRLAIEEHGAGRQLVRLRWWPRILRPGVVLLALTSALVVGALATGHWRAVALLGALAVVSAGRLAYECGTAVTAARLAAGARRAAEAQVEGLEALDRA